MLVGLLFEPVKYIKDDEFRYLLATNVSGSVNPLDENDQELIILILQELKELKALMDHIDNLHWKMDL